MHCCRVFGDDRRGLVTDQDQRSQTTHKGRRAPYPNLSTDVNGLTDVKALDALYAVTIVCAGICGNRIFQASYNSWSNKADTVTVDGEYSNGVLRNSYTMTMNTQSNQNAARHFARQHAQSRNEKVLAGVLKKTVKDDHRTLASQDFSPVFENAIMDDRAWDKAMSDRCFTYAADSANPLPIRNDIQKVGENLKYANQFFAKCACTHTDVCSQCRKISRMFTCPQHQMSLVGAYREASTEERKMAAVVSAAAILGCRVFSYVIKHKTLEDALENQNRIMDARRYFGAEECVGITSWNLHDNTVVGLMAFEGYVGDNIGLAKDLLILLSSNKFVKVEQLTDPSHLRTFYRQYPDTMKRIGVDRVLGAYIERKLVARERAAESDDEGRVRKRATNLRWRKSNGLFNNSKKVLARAYEMIDPKQYPQLATSMAAHTDLTEKLGIAFTAEDGEYADAWLQAEDMQVLQKRAAAIEAENLRDVRASNVVLGVLKTARAKARKHKREHARAQAPEEVLIAKPAPHMNTLCKVHGKPMQVVEVVAIGAYGGNVRQLSEWVKAAEAAPTTMPKVTVVMPPKPVAPTPFKPVYTGPLFTTGVQPHAVFAPSVFAPLVAQTQSATTLIAAAKAAVAQQPMVSEFDYYTPSRVTDDGVMVW